MLSVKIRMVITDIYRKRPSRPKQRLMGLKLKWQRWRTRVPKRQRTRWKLKRKKMTHRPWRKFQVRMREKRKFNFVDVKSFWAIFVEAKIMRKGLCWMCNNSDCVRWLWFSLSLWKFAIDNFWRNAFWVCKLMTFLLLFIMSRLTSHAQAYF